MTKKIDSAGWITWEGGVAPMIPNVTVEVRFRDGTRCVNEVDAFVWKHGLGDADIVAYRVLSQPESDNPNDIQTGGTHYKDMGIEPWDVIDTWPIEQQIGYHRGNILKYTMRMGSKDERLKEAKKIAHYAQKLVSVLEKENG